jgi:hypothetical protein
MKCLIPPSSGSIAGVTYSHNRAGQYTRNRRAPVQPVGTGRRGIVRNNMSAASSGWAAVDPTTQLAWDAYAAGHPITDVLGQAIKLTGHQMYVAVNATRLNAGLDMSDDVPESDSVFAAGFSAFTATAPETLSLTPSGDGDTADKLLVAVSAPQSSGRRFCKTFWQIATAAGDAVTPILLGDFYVAQFGIFAAGQRIFYKLTPVNQYGVKGVPNMGFIEAG